MTIPQLVESFAAAALAQDRAELVGETKEFPRLMQIIAALQQELKSREGDQRHALLALYDHPNAEVRLQAAMATLVAAPAEARKLLRTIWESNRFPQAADAGMTLAWLEDGRFKPE